MVVFIKSIKWHQSVSVLAILVPRKLVCGARVGGDSRGSSKRQQRDPHFSWWLLWLPSLEALESRRLRTGRDCCWVEASFASVWPWQVIYSKLYLYPGLVGRIGDTVACKPCGPVWALSRSWLSPSACFPQWYRLSSTTARGTCLLNQYLVSEWNRSSFHQAAAACEHS